MSFASTFKANSGWTPEDDQILVDATLRNQRASAIRSLLPGRTKGAINGRISYLKKPHVWGGVERKMLPRDWTVKEENRVPTYRFEEDEELVRWRCNGCTGLKGAIFDDWQSKKSLRSRLTNLEKESETLSGSVVIGFKDSPLLLPNSLVSYRLKKSFASRKSIQPHIQPKSGIRSAHLLTGPSRLPCAWLPGVLLPIEGTE